MTYTITQDCIGCQRCLSACPTEAIQTNGLSFWI
ncbi:MAG: 4Fe-4S binding protein, partial [Cyanobacteria bacterium P01_F01_bin.86]